MPVKIIAEIAQGYEGDATLAKLLAKAATRSGADAVKFQVIFADELAVPSYQYYHFFKKLEMSKQTWSEVAEIVKNSGQSLYFDVFGENSLELAHELQADGVKIHATDFFNNELIEAALQEFSQLFVSIGGISFNELKDFFNLYHTVSVANICLMYGFQAEPTPIDSNNLLRINTLNKMFPETELGFMDHSDGESEEANTLALMALPLGISYIEKHLSLDRSLELEDYPSALAPSVFRKFVTRIKHMEQALGSNENEMGKEEMKYRSKVLKRIVTARAVNKGEILTADSLYLLRVPDPKPGAIYQKKEAEGQIINLSIEKYEQITKEMLR